MDYENKYKEALAAAKHYYEELDSDTTKNVLEEIFPELQESEDEKIRKEIIEYIKTGTYHKSWLAWLEKQGEHANFRFFPELKESKESEDERIRKRLLALIEWSKSFAASGITTNDAKDMLTWLEKQGEHANFRNKIQIGDKVTRNEDGMLVNLSQLKRVAKPAEKQGEPIRDTDTVDSNEDGLIAETIKYKHENQDEQKPADIVEPKFKVEEGKWYICISQFCNCIEGRVYKATFNNRIIDDFGTEYDMHSDAYKYFRLWTIKDSKAGDILVIKEGKRPFIFKGFVDNQHPECPVAYCGIDIENEFCIPDNTAWWTDAKVCPSTKEQRDFLFRKIKEAGYEWDAEKKELKKVEQKSAEWSEEDKSYLNTTIAYLKDAKEFKKTAENCINWLKSLKDRYRWKPSEEQMKCLSDVVHKAKYKNDISVGGYSAYMPLASLYLDLKKLTE